MKKHYGYLGSLLVLASASLMCATPPATRAPAAAAPATDTPQAAEPATRAPQAVTPIATITYYPIIEKPWNRIPTVVIASAKDDPRIPLAEKAVDFWNGQLQALGSPFHLGSIVQTEMQIPDADLIAIGNPDAQGKLSAAGAALMQKMPGDLVIDLSEANFVSVTHGAGDKRLIAIQAHPGGQDSDVINMNVIAHEIGHSIGLGHNNDPAMLMCGRPATCRPGGDQFVGIQGFAPLTDVEKAYLLKLYPPGWKPAQ